MNQGDATPPADRGDWFASEFATAAPALFAWARLRLTAVADVGFDADDLLQEVGCRAYAARATFAPDRGNFRQWLFGFATRVFLEAMRNRQRGPDGAKATFVAPSGSREIAATITTISRQLARGEFLQSFLTCVDELAVEDRELLLYHGLEGLPHARVATLLGLGEATVRKRWQRLCDRLRQDPGFASLIAD